MEISRQRKDVTLLLNFKTKSGDHRGKETVQIDRLLTNAMKDCETCGNEIPDREMICRFWYGSPQPVRSKVPRRECLRTINVEAGRPTVEVGLDKLERELASAMQARVSVVRVIHGYGSTGKGGRLRDECRAFLRRMLKAGQIKAFVPGDDYSNVTNAGRALMSAYPELRDSERTDRLNPASPLCNCEARPAPSLFPPVKE